MWIDSKIGKPELVMELTKDQLYDYWFELKQTRYDSYFFREIFERVRKINPNLVLPDEEYINLIEQEAMNIAMWEENWEKINRERVKNGGVDYSLFNAKPEFKIEMNNKPVPIKKFNDIGS